jgi:hypothetical protein
MIFYLDAEILLDLFLLILYPLKSEMVELAEDRYLELREKQLWQRKIINRKEYLKFMQNTL